MATVRIEVQPVVLEWVANHAQNLNDKWLQKLNLWLSGEKQPTLKQLKDVSNAAKIPFGYFFLNEAPQEDLPLLKYRTVDNIEIEHPSRDLIEIMEDMVTKQEWLSEYRQEAGFEKNQFNGAAQRLTRVEGLTDQQKAAEILKSLGLKSGWNLGNRSFNRFKFLRAKLNATGVTVMEDGMVKGNTHRTLNQKEFRAFAMTDDYAPLIFINSRDSYNAELFSLVHELVHIWCGQPELFNYDFNVNTAFRHPVTEQDINHIAEEILFSQPIFMQIWQETLTDSLTETVIATAGKFGTSPLSAGIRAVRLKLITQKVVDELKKQLEEEYKRLKQKQRNSGGGPLPARTQAAHMDHDFIADVVRSTNSGEITYTKAFELLNVKDGSRFDKLMVAVKESEK